MQVQVPTKSPGHLVRAPSGKTPFNIISILLWGFGKSLFELHQYIELLLKCLFEDIDHI